jgi:hypothetical protein
MFFLPMMLPGESLVHSRADLACFTNLKIPFLIQLDFHVFASHVPFLLSRHAPFSIHVASQILCVATDPLREPDSTVVRYEPCGWVIRFRTYLRSVKPAEQLARGLFDRFHPSLLARIGLRQF